MKNLDRAIRVYRALTESPVQVDSASLRSWAHVERALGHAPTLLVEMKALPRSVRERVMAYVGEFSPLVESRPIFLMPDGLATKSFVKEVAGFGGKTSTLDGGLVAATGPDMAAIESIATRLGGVLYDGPSLKDAFEYVDTTLPEAMMGRGLEPALVEQALIDALYANGKNGALTESAGRLFAGIKVESTLDRFKNRLASFARPKPVLGVSRRLAEAVRLSGMATPEMVKLLEAGDPPGVSAGNSGVSAPTTTDRGGISKDQPDSRGMSPANSKSGDQKAQTPPTEHVPSTEQGSPTNAVRLPDGTEVPMDTLRQAFAKMLHNMATQVEQGTVGGQPSPRGADQQDATGTPPPEPSVPQQQVAMQTASQKAAGAGAEPANQPAQANGQPPAPPQEQQPAAPPPPGQPDQAAQAPEAPAAPPPAAPAPAPQAGGQLAPTPPGQGAGNVEAALVKAEAGDEEALKQAQGMQGQMSDQQKQRLQALLAKKQAPPAPGANVAGPPQAESRQATLRRGLAMMESPRERHILAGLALVERSGLRDQPSMLAERVRDKLSALAIHRTEAVRCAARQIIETSRASEAASSPGAQAFVGGEVSKLMKKGPSSGPQKGQKFGQKQAVAAALNVAREKGYKVPAKKENIEDEPNTYVRTSEGTGFFVWENISVSPAGILPAGLAYGASEAKPGTQVVIMESGPETCVVRLPGGDAVRVSKSHIKEEAGAGYVADQRVATYSLSGMMESLARDGVKHAVIVAGGPTSGRGYFIRTKLAPWARRMQERVATMPFPNLESATGAEARRDAIDEMRLATAREDHAALAAAVDEGAFDSALVTDQRFRHVVDGRGVMLRDALPWKMFEQCRANFDRYFAIPAVQKYYGGMGSGPDRLAEAAIKRMVSERRTPAFVQMGGVLMVDAPPRANIVKIAETARRAGIAVTIVEMRLDLKTTLARGKVAKLRESRIIANYNAARAGLDAARRAQAGERFVTYNWRTDGGPFDGRFVCEADTSMPGKDDTVAVVTKKNIDGEDGPTREKSMAVTSEARRPVREALDVGQASEAESCASGMKEAGEQLKAAREAVFKLTAETLVKCSAMAKATGAKRTERELAKAQQFAATFLDDLQKLAQQVDRANEVMKGENGGMGGDTLDAMKQMQQMQGGAGAPPAPAAPTPAPTPPPAAPAPAAPAAPAPAPAVESIVTADQAVSYLLETDIAERVAQGENYRSLNEAIMARLPYLGLHGSVETIDRIKAITSVPLDATIRVQFGAVDHRLLSEAASFGSMASLLASRTRGGVATLASEAELRNAVTALRKHGKATHAMLASALESAIGGRGSHPGRSLTEFDDRSGRGLDRAKAAALLNHHEKAEDWALNVSHVSVDQAMTHAEQVYRSLGGNVEDELPHLEDHFKLLKAKMHYARDIPRIDMPVIEPQDIHKFAADLEAGRVDIFPPYAAGHLKNLFPWERGGNPKMFGDKEWVTLGVKDGDPRDDVINTAPQMIPVKNLKPLQNAIYFDKLILTCAAYGAVKSGSPVLTKGVIIVSNDGFILDGHHRFGQVYLSDPSLAIKGLRIDLDVDTLLKVSRSYGSAIGNKAKR